MVDLVPPVLVIEPVLAIASVLASSPSPEIISLSLLDTVMLLVTAMLAGMFNAIAGGGGFLVFPALLLLGMPPVSANATNTIGLMFGVLTSAFTYRKHLMHQEKSGFTAQDFWGLTLISLVGGVIGSLLLLRLPSTIFTQLVPYLMLMAAGLFTFNPLISRWLRRRQRDVQQGTGQRGHARLPFGWAIALQLVIAIYGGYFGGGVSIVMLAVLNFMGLPNLNAMNGMKSWLGAVFNCVAVVLFIQAGKVVWLPALIVAVGSIVGAYGSATIAQRIPPGILRGMVVAIAWVMTVYLFWRSWQ